MTKSVICRRGNDEFKALKLARGMENAGADVFSITTCGGFFFVFAKYEDPVTRKTIDEAIVDLLKGYTSDCT